jgi:hypothetical protein
VTPPPPAPGRLLPSQPTENRYDRSMRARFRLDIAPRSMRTTVGDRSSARAPNATRTLAERVCRPAHSSAPTKSTSRRSWSSVRSRSLGTIVGNFVIGGIVIAGYTSSGETYLQRRREGWLTPEEGGDEDDEDADDLALRWNVASIVACIPLLAPLAWILPEISVGSWDGDERRGAIEKNDAYAFAVAYWVAFGLHNFDITDPFIWGTTLLCAAHIQLEKTNTLLVNPNGPAGARSPDDEDALSAISKKLEAVTTSTAGKAEPAKNSVEAAAKIGRVIGKAGVVAKALGEGISEGKVEAEIQRESLVMSEELTRQAEALTEELGEWDGRLEGSKGLKEDPR